MRPVRTFAGRASGIPIVVLDLHLGSDEPAYEALRDLVDEGRQVIVYSMRDDTGTPVALCA